MRGTQCIDFPHEHSATDLEHAIPSSLDKVSSPSLSSRVYAVYVHRYKNTILWNDVILYMEKKQSGVCMCHPCRLDNDNVSQESLMLV